MGKNSKLSPSDVKTGKNLWFLKKVFHPKSNNNIYIYIYMKKNVEKFRMAYCLRNYEYKLRD